MWVALFVFRRLGKFAVLAAHRAIIQLVDKLPGGDRVEQSL